MSSDPDSSSIDPRAEQLFVEQVVRGEGPVDLEALSREHPEQAEALRELHRRWSSAVRGASLIDRLRRRHGDELQLDLSLEEPLEDTPDEGAAARRPGSSGAAGPSSSVYGRLAAHGDTAGRYRRDREIARGGMGVILKVWDEDLRRTLAMKVALTREASEQDDSSADARDSRLLNRFLEEAQITGQLDHPGIVPVHELGLDADGRVYFTMRLVKGGDLKSVFEKVHAGAEGWTLTRALGVMLKVCEAMAFAHEKGVIHRDLKPANIMVGRFGETYVMDWGLARVLGRQDSHDVRLREVDASLSVVRTDRADDRTPDSPLVTMDGDVVGTPCYMSPEQARGKLEDIGPRSDVYALGSMLYHLLTGRMPYVEVDEKISPHTVLGLLLKGPPVPIRELNRTAPDELVSICEKAMQREAAARYADLQEVADDLRAFLEDRVVRAHASGSVAEFKKWIRRNRAAAFASAAAVLLAVAGLVTVVLVQARANEDLSAAKKEVEGARDEALDAQEDLEVANAELAAARDEADAKARLARRNEYAANVAAAGASLRLADTSEVRRRLGLCDPELRGWEWRHLDLASDPSERDLEAGEVTVQRLAFQPGGDLLATRGSDDVVRLIAVTTGEELGRIDGAGGNVGVLEFTPDGRTLATSGDDRRVHLWDVDSGEELRALGSHESVVSDVAFDPTGRLVATTSDDIVRVWDLESGELVHTLEGHGSTALCASFGPRGRLLATGARDQSVRVWDLEIGRERLALTGPEYAISFVDFDPSGLRLVAGFTAYEASMETFEARGGNTLRMWDVEDGALLGVFAGPTQQLVAGGFSPDGLQLFAAARDASLWLWDLIAGRDQVVIGHLTGLNDAAFAPDGLRLATAGGNSSVKLWYPGLQFGFELRAHSSPIVDLTFTPDGDRLLTASLDATVRSWDTSTGLVGDVIRGHANAVYDVDVSVDGEHLATAAADGTVRWWDARTGRELNRWESGESSMRFQTDRSPRCVEIHPDGRRVIVGGPFNRVSCWDSETGAVLTEYVGVPEGEQALVVRCSPDGRLVLSSSARIDRRSATLYLWDVETGELVHRRETEPRVTSFEYAPDGGQIAVAFTSLVHLLRPDDLSDVRVLAGHVGSVDSLSYSPDGRRLATGSSDETARLWDVETGETLLTLQSPGIDVACVEFSPDGEQLAVAYENNDAFLWDARPTVERVEAHAQAVAERRRLLPILDGLFARFPTPDAVVERLRNDPSLDTADLRTAVGLASQVATNRRQSDRESWRVLRTPGSSEVELHLALWSAHVALQEREDDRAQRILGITQYRLGKLIEAVASLERSNELRRNRSRVETLAFLSMAYHRLGDEARAQDAYASLRLLMQVPLNLVKRENQVLLGETEAILRGVPDAR